MSKGSGVRRGGGGGRGYRQDRRVRENKQMTQKNMFSDFQK